MARKKARIEEVKIELTPMIDVTFLLLIFFMVAMKFKILEGKLQTHLPKDVGPNPQDIPVELEKFDISIELDPTMTEGFRVAINNLRMPNLNTFRARLASFVKNSPETKATLYPAQGVTYDHVVQVVDECIKADMLDITFAGVAFDA